MSALVPLVLAGHLIGDWIVQTDWQAANKVRPARPSRAGSLRPGDVLTAAGVERDGKPITDEQLRRAAWRRALRRSWRANQQHMLGYHATLAVLVCPPWAALTGLRSLLLIAVSWATHSLIDRRWPVRWLCARTGSRAFGETTFGLIAVDQTLHLSILLIAAAALS